MTDETNLSDGSTEPVNQSEGGMQNNDAGSETSSSSEPIEGEKLLKQSEVDNIVKSVKQKTADKVREQIRLESYAPQNQRPPVNPAEQENQSVDKSLSEDRVRELVNQESERLSNEAVANRIANDFQNKITAAKEKYPDIDQAIEKLNLPSIPHLAVWANSLDNTADVMYEISQHPSKFANLLTLAQQSPHLAVMEMQKLSESIKKNQQDADQHKQANEPLNQIKPSPTGSDNGTMSIADYKKQDWLRG